MHPGWVALIVAVSAPWAFLALHAFFWLLAYGSDAEPRPYEFPIKIYRRGPRFCPHCGKQIRE